MPKYFMSGTKYAAFERMMMEATRSERHPEQRKKPSQREGKNLPSPRGEQAKGRSE